MQTSSQLREALKATDRKSYPAYKSLKGEYRFKEYILSIDHVQGDPFASPSHLTARIPHETAGFPENYLSDRLHRTTLADFLLRRFYGATGRMSFQAKGSGKSGLVSVSRCGQEILERTACEVTDKEILVRFHVGFPARGRTIDAPELDKILFDLLPRGIHDSFLYASLDKEALKKHIELREDQAFIRQVLSEKSLIAFVADGSILPRASGVSPLPMKDALPFESPASMRITLQLPHKGPLSGMAIPKGVTLIAGGGYHGKSTLLAALQSGVYNHIRSDGREYVITDDTAVKLRAEEGRFVKDVDISMFIDNLPGGRDTRRFSTQDASGSTSQAAGIMESLEAGSQVFLMDEDTSAANFMVRDSFMQRVIATEKEPITPYLERVRELYEKAGVSTILVAGSSGAFFHVADRIIQMDAYRPVDITEKVKALCKDYPVEILHRDNFHTGQTPRVMTRPAEEKSRRNYYGDTVSQPERLKIRIQGKDGFSLGHNDVDLSALEQLADSEQTAALAFLLKEAFEKMIDGKRTLPDIVSRLYDRIEKEGLSVFCSGGYVSAGYAVPRLQELYGCFNRCRRP